MPYGLLLPAYSKVSHWEGVGNFAVKKYYKWPFSFFYQKKLRMILAMFERGRIYRNILDFGAGHARIFHRQLKRHAINVHSADTRDEINMRVKYDVIVCASVLEFVWLPTTLPVLKMVLKPNGMILVSSPMDTWLSRAYFKLIKNDLFRHSHELILEELKKTFTVTHYRTWFGLYFSCKAVFK